MASKVSAHESYYLKPDSLTKAKDRACPHSSLSSTPSSPLSFFFFFLFFYNSFVIKDREYMYIAAKANTRHDPIYKIK